MPRISVIATIAERELIRYWRDRARMVSTLFQPLMFLFVFGAGLQQTLSRGSFGVDFIQFMYPGIVAMNIMGTAFFSTISTVWDREFGFLKEILVAPVSRTDIAAGKMLGATIVATLQGLVLLAIAPLIGVHLHILIVLRLAVFMVLVAFAISGLGLFIASAVQTVENFGVIMNFFVFPLFFLSGAFFPLTAVPQWMSIIASANPLAYGVDAMRQILLAPQVNADALAKLVLRAPAMDALFLMVFAGVFLSAAVLAFNRRT
ncbi:MAG: ABC transporter permease [Patescibacteria group bacterium]|nr:ABC transporter permease [Patescibacteria group bacterium]